MKIVFMTPDRIVDRRIILEALSLAQNGHSSSVIADLGPGCYSYVIHPNIKIINAVSPEKSSESGAFSLKDPIKKLVGGSAALRKILKKAYYFLFFSLQAAKPPMERKLYPIENLYYEKAVIEKADVYVACDLPMLSAASRASEKTSAALIYDAHEFYTEQSIFSPSERNIMAESEEALLKKADLVITVNDSIADLFSKKYGIKPSVIFNCTSAPPSFRQNKKYNTIREKIGLKENEKIVLFQGGYLPGRNLENLIISSKHLNDGITLVLLGYGDFIKKLEMLTKKHGKDNVKFIDAVSQEELLFYTASADLGIIPYQPVDLNTKLCTPNKLFEFIQAGIPVLAEKELKELDIFINREKIGFLRDLSTPEAVAQSINEIMSDVPGLISAKERCIEIAPSYDWKKEGKVFARLFDESYERFQKKRQLT